MNQKIDFKKGRNKQSEQGHESQNNFQYIVRQLCASGEENRMLYQYKM